MRLPGHAAARTHALRSAEAVIVAAAAAATDPPTIAACWNALSRLVRSSPAQQAWLRAAAAPALLHPLLATTLHRLHEPHHAASAVSGLAALQLGTGFAPAEAAWAELTSRVAGGAHALPPTQLAGVAHACAAAGRSAPRLFDAIGAAAAEPRCLAAFTPRELTSTAWAFAAAEAAEAAALEARGAASVPWRGPSSPGAVGAEALFGPRGTNGGDCGGGDGGGGGGGDG